MDKFTKRLLELRQEKGVTQIQVSEGTGLSNATIANYEIGKRTPAMACLIRLANYFNCSIDYLVGISDD